jgi:hypothetical protein
MEKSTATFTLRDLNRQPSKVLDAVRKFGSAEVRTRSGEVFTVAVKVDEANEQRSKTLPDFKARWKKLRESGNVPPSPDENERINRIVASEE